MRHLLAAAMLGACLAAAPCRAQDADTPEARAQAALALQQAMGGDAALARAFAGLRPSLIRLLTQTGKMNISRAADMVDQVELPELLKHAPDIETAKARIYAKYFTVHDLQTMTAFYRSPTGQKMLANQVAIAADSMASMQPLIRDVQAHEAEYAKSQAAAAPHGTPPQTGQQATPKP